MSTVVPAFNVAYFTPKLPPCSHNLTGRSTFANPSNEVYVSCGRCGATLDTIRCDTPVQARLVALMEQREPNIPF